MNITALPNSWLKVLEVIRSEFPDAIIAGGAIRDLICDHPVKDVDIFAFDSEKGSLDAITEKLGIKRVNNLSNLANDIENHLIVSEDFLEDKENQQRDFLELRINHGVRSEYSESFLEDHSLVASFINSITDILYEGIKFQLILIEVPSVQFVTNTFDFGLCKCWTDGSTVKISDEFWYDYENKKLTWAGKFSKSQMLHTILNHAPRLKKKFPSYEIMLDAVTELDEDSYPPSYQKIKAEYIKIEKNDFSEICNVSVGEENSRSYNSSFPENPSVGYYHYDISSNEAYVWTGFEWTSSPVINIDHTKYPALMASFSMKPSNIETLELGQLNVSPTSGTMNPDDYFHYYTYPTKN